MLNLAVDDGYIRNNPTDNVLKDLKRSHIFTVTKRSSLTKAEQDLLLKFLRNHPQYCHWYPIFAVLVGTGLRVGEVTGLRWCDIDMDEGIIDVNHTLVYYPHRENNKQSSCYFSINTPKTNAGKRQVPMLDFVKEAFIMEQNYQHSRGLSCNVTVDGYSDFIFINRLGATYCHGTLNEAIQRIVKKCNEEVLRQGNANSVFLPQFTCHSLRHTFTTRMCEAGVNIKVMQDTLGHASITTTLDIYADVTKELKRDEFSSLNSYFNQAMALGGTGTSSEK
jgi:integrase